MSSQIIVHGYLEMPIESEENNAIILDEIARSNTCIDYDIAQEFGPIRIGWRSAMCSFAQSYKRIDEDDCERIQKNFEKILAMIVIISAHLSLEDLDSEDGYCIDYIYGPAHFGGPDVWTRVYYRRRDEVAEELGGTLT